MANPYYSDPMVTIYHGRCEDIVPTLGRFDMLLTDPPYGIGANKMSLGSGRKEYFRGDTSWDAAAPDVQPIVAMCDRAIIWGGNYLAGSLPVSDDWLVWHKKNDGRSFGEVELAWSNIGCKTRIIAHHWGGEAKYHPTQKPFAIMAWCLSLVDPRPTSVLDPFMGSGTTVVACRKAGIKSVGIDAEEKYCEIAARRVSQMSLFEQAA